MKNACQTIGYCEIGKAVITLGFDLPAKYVIHTVGPAWHGGAYGEETILNTPPPDGHLNRPSQTP